ncbi:Alpha/Beta hydrolase protein [Aspergillus egyptiacus]|nr:Alpha/Beta hydrolase protein [Aspergillus egyptiacus]
MNWILIFAILAVKALGWSSARAFSELVHAPLRDPQVLLPQGPQDTFSSGYGRMVNEKSSLTLLYQNNLNMSDDSNHVGAILLSPMGQRDIRDACEELGESMISLSTIEEYEEDFLDVFSYLLYTSGPAEEVERAYFYIRNGVLAVTKGDAHFEHYPFPSRDIDFPVLCTQTSTGNEAIRENKAARKLVRVNSRGITYIGFRDQKSFRFLGIPYAQSPDRFSYPTPYSDKPRTLRTTEYGPICAQINGGSEDCLYLNIQTPYIPQRDSTRGLRPVLFWIHDGDFTDGIGSDVVADGGNLASREDIVVVTFNYRLSTLGFLAVPGTDIRGNYGIADQVLALKWTIKNIAQFGGDPGRITIIGASAGASSVKALLGSPSASGKFQGAVAMSSLGSDDGHGLANDSYMSVSESYEKTGKRIFHEAGCDEGTIDQQVSCLKQLPASTLVRLPTVARHIVQDGRIVNAPDSSPNKKDTGTLKVPIILGNTADEGASFAKYPSISIRSPLEGLTSSLDIDTFFAQHILDSGLFPYHDTGNLTLDSFNVSQRIATDLHIRCHNQAHAALLASSSNTSHPVYYYQTQRTSTNTAGLNPNNLPGPLATHHFPTGDPDLPYFRLHGADIPFVFGNLGTIRDPLDLRAAQLISAYFAEFVRSGQPNPSIDFLAARGYNTTLEAVEVFDRWEAVNSSSGPIHLLDFPSEKAAFRDLQQCAFLGIPVT